MPKTAIVSDTLTEIPKEMAAEYGVRLIPLYITLDDRSYPENEIDLEWYYSQTPKWKAEGKMPLTSSIPVGTFLETFRELSVEADAIMYIGHSSKFGMSVTSAMQAKEQLKNELPKTRIEVIDSLTVCGALMLIVIEAARRALAGSHIEDIVNVTTNMVKKVHYTVLIDDLSLLAKGGRIHRARPWADSKVTNTALLEASYSTAGQMTPMARYKTRPKALESLFDIVKDRSGEDALHVSINCTSASFSDAEQLREVVYSRLNCREVFLTKIYPLVVNHVGVEPVHFSWWGGK